jgi:hypothetical protein
MSQIFPQPNSSRLPRARQTRSMKKPGRMGAGYYDIDRMKEKLFHHECVFF